MTMWRICNLYRLCTEEEGFIWLELTEVEGPDAMIALARFVAEEFVGGSPVTVLSDSMILVDTWIIKAEPAPVTAQSAAWDGTDS